MPEEMSDLQRAALAVTAARQNEDAQRIARDNATDRENGRAQAERDLKKWEKAIRRALEVGGQYVGVDERGLCVVLDGRRSAQFKVGLDMNRIFPRFPGIENPRAKVVAGAYGARLQALLGAPFRVTCTPEYYKREEDRNWDDPHDHPHVTNRITINWRKRDWDR